jgi:hypothetical protein
MPGPANRTALREAVSAGSATCAVMPAADSSSATYRQPVHPSSANATSPRPANRASHAAYRRHDLAASGDARDE